TSGELAPGSYVVRGTTTDASGDKGKFFFDLRVSLPVVTPIVQSAPFFSSIATTAASSFTYQLAVSGASGAVTFTQTTGAPNLVVSSTGLVTTSGELAPGSYVVRGTTTDASGDKGKFFFDLRVNALVATTTTTTTTTTTPPPPPPPPKRTSLVASRVIGHAIAGRIVSLVITGFGFSGRPVVTSHAGTTAYVTKDTGTMLVVRVQVRPGSRNGVFTFTIVLANGDSCRVQYTQRP
ncbi:MAG: hypothetical protein ACYCPT_09595, partial [Acidimicrobiales bacterium]